MKRPGKGASANWMVADFFLMISLALMAAPGGRAVFGALGVAGSARGPAAASSAGEAPPTLWPGQDGSWSVHAGTATTTWPDAAAAAQALQDAGRREALAAAPRGIPFAAYLELPARAQERGITVSAVLPEEGADEKE